MSSPKSSSPLARALPFLVVGIAGLAAGVFLATRSDGPSGVDPASALAAETTATGTPPDAAAEAAELEGVQATLERSLLLPSDFRTVPAFTLSDVDGEPLTESVLEGRWSLMFFGFTNCPDVCPVTLSVMKDVVAELESSGEEPMQVLFVTVDPVRDTAERMKEYVAFFDEDFVGVTGELADVHALTRELGIVAAFTANERNPKDYGVDHTASMLLVDPERRVRAKFNAPHEVATIVADYTTIRAALN